MYDKREFTKEEVERAVSTSISYAELARKLGYSSNTGHYISDAQKWVNKYNCDTSHFKGQKWNKGNFNFNKLQEKKVFKGGELLKFLINVMNKPRQCECCKNVEWNGEPIPLNVHHIDGNHYNNDLSNLQILCPNCHAQTDSFCGRGRLKKLDISDEQIINMSRDSHSISEVIRKLGICDTQRNRLRIEEVIKKNNISFLKRQSIKENREYKKLFKSSIEKKEKNNNRKEYFLSGKIDFNKFGWVEQASRDLGLSHTQIRRWVNKNLPDIQTYKRKSPSF